MKAASGNRQSAAGSAHVSNRAIVTAGLVPAIHDFLPFGAACHA